MCVVFFRKKFETENSYLKIEKGQSETLFRWKLLFIMIQGDKSILCKWTWKKSFLPVISRTVGKP